MSIPVSQDLDFGAGFQLIAAMMENRASDPGTPKLGMFWIRDSVMRYWNGTAVVTVGSGGVATVGVTAPIQNTGTAADPVIAIQAASGSNAGSMSAAHYTLLAGATNASTGSTLVLRDASGNFAAGTITASLTGTASNASQLNSQSASYYLSRANHTGTQAASTISDLATVVKAYRLDEFAVPTAALNLNSQKITNLANGTNPNDAVNLGQVQGMLQGLDPKGSVRAATTAAGTLASSFANGQSVGGVTVATGDRILIRNQAAPAENGIYTVNASGAPTRATDADAWAELPGAYTFVEEGTLAGTGWVCNVAAGGTLGTTAVTFVQFAGAGEYTGTNLGAGTVSFFKQISGTQFQFNTMSSANTAISLALASDLITVTFNAGNVDKNTLGGSALTVANGGTGLSSTSQNFVFAGPTSGSGAPTWRALVAGDIPNHDFSKITTGIVPLSQGGTGLNLGSHSAFPGTRRIPVRVAATANITVATPGATIDGVTMAAGDRVLLTAQTTTSQNGLWVWNGAAAAMTRPTDYPASGTVHAFYGILVEVMAGTARAGATYVLTTTGAITIDSTATTWTLFTYSVASGSVTGVLPLANGGTGSGTAAGARTNLGATGKYAVSIGDGTTLSFNITHNLGTTDVTVNCWETGGSKRKLPLVEERIVDANTVQIVFGTGAAPAASGARVVVIG